MPKCTNKGCQKEFEEGSNEEGSCAYHPGGPVCRGIQIEIMLIARSSTRDSSHGVRIVIFQDEFADAQHAAMKSARYISRHPTSSSTDATACDGI